VIVIGHRGAAGLAPEHTFASWDLALEIGVDYIEQDLQMTVDGVLVVMHDDSLDRTARGAGCRGAVRKHTWKEIQACDVGSWFNEQRPDRARPHFAGQTIPTLDAVFSTYRGRARFYIETKNPKAAPGMEMELLRLMSEHGLRPQSPDDHTVILQSFSSDSLRLLRSHDPNVPLIRLFAPFETNWTIRQRLRRVARYANGIGPSFRDVDARLVGAAHDLGLVVHPYTVNVEADMRRMIALGVDGMFSDLPDLLIRVRAELAAEGLTSL
jgi:glycerophosphoryl diester phosphodiesterase